MQSVARCGVVVLAVLAGCGSNSSSESVADSGGGDSGGGDVAATDSGADAPGSDSAASDTSASVDGGDAGTDACATPACVRVVDLSTWQDTTCGVLSEGHAFCWGSNDSGQVGDGTMDTPKLSPALVSKLSNVVKISAGVGHTCALLADKSVSCWGSNFSGELGDGTKTGRATPAPVLTDTGKLTNVTAIVARGSYSCALLEDHTISCWGAGPTATTLTATGVAGVTDVQAIGGDFGNVCTLSAAGVMSCFDTKYVNPTGVVAQLALGDASRCARLADATVDCWGEGYQGELGDGLTTTRNTAGPVPGLAGVTDLASGQFHYCAIRSATDVVCWGKNGNHQLADGTTTNVLSPKAFTAIPGGVTKFALGDGHSCAIGTDGKVYCWGSNGSGQLGDGTGKDQPLPTPVLTTPP